MISTWYPIVAHVTTPLGEDSGVPARLGVLRPDKAGSFKPPHPIVQGQCVINSTNNLKLPGQLISRLSKPRADYKRI